MLNPGTTSCPAGEGAWCTWRRRRSRLWLGLAAALCFGILASPAEPATDEAGLARAAVDTFARAAESLDRGDTAAALQALDGMAASVAELRASAER